MTKGPKSPWNYADVAVGLWLSRVSSREFAQMKGNGGSDNLSGLDRRIGPQPAPPDKSEAAGRRHGNGSLHLPSPATFASSSKQPIVELVSAEATEPAPIDRVWDGWLAKGKLQLLAGQPGAGKTTLALALAATTSIGGIWPDGSQATEGNVVIWSGEDDPKDTLVPRLIAAGADRTRVHFVTASEKAGETLLWSRKGHGSSFAGDRTHQRCETHRDRSDCDDGGEGFASERGNAP